MLHYCKLTHSTHEDSFEDPFAVPYFPGPQSKHTAEEVPPIVVEYVPWEHLAQLMDPTCSAYLPLVHSKQGEDEDAFGFFFHPAGHSKQKADPGGLKRPFEQLTQSLLLSWCVGSLPSSANANPAGHKVPESSTKRYEEKM